MRTRRFRGVALGFVIATLAAGLTLVQPAAASGPSAPRLSTESASGCMGYGPTVNGIRVGTYCVFLSGTGRSVTSVTGRFTGSTVCNWDISAEFFDSNGNWYKTYRTPRTNNCRVSASGYIYINRTMRTGSMCSTLRQNGRRVTSVCHSIHS